ncbi:hypothetical protein LOTGIDRAFT_163148 [Lottia gigantea]|uniref:Uncharacterized protein n=1 Tax=Lottia gigantea TaxID=225164 RepID=V4A4Z7_LOTGI|nr:hypothetical protein LOTGIDRAFT_163148 [Lottia gigantea]ESO91787.1 hypothetical protein LOTGIDRAFT_163148 [Lottia gigantea]
MWKMKTLLTILLYKICGKGYSDKRHSFITNFITTDCGSDLGLIPLVLKSFSVRVRGVIDNGMEFFLGLGVDGVPASFVLCVPAVDVCVGMGFVGFNLSKRFAIS